MSDWQPIETAPIPADDDLADDVWLLGCKAGTKFPVPISYFHGVGWYPLNDIFKNWKPTHWMPLPEPPKADVA